MKAFVVRQYAHPSKISLTLDAPEPMQAKDTILVDVYSAGLNFFDILQAQGKHQSKPPFPFILGSEFAGVVVPGQVFPPGCPFKPGDRVFGSAPGCFAERVAARIDNLEPMPDTLSFDQAAGLYVTYPTSFEALDGRAKVQPGEWVLVTAAAGGVGIAAVQIAKALGAKVIAACSSSKLQVVRDWGRPDAVVDYTADGWQKQILHLTAGHGVDVVYDPVGRVRESLKCIAWNGRVLIVGFAGGTIESIPMNLVLLKNISLVGIHWGPYQEHDPERKREVWRRLLQLLAENRLPPVLYPTVFTLDTVVDGLAELEARKTFGKVVMRVRDCAPPGASAKL
ncbi:hypothetical protein K488DRAFT_52741 [Vararia minispora EC-137]|uniref:Uncharacterized protein n=1 Tax=Vararia minispora EC-137 TaxID=1314806 RepID=A0ACB8QGZ3_9AGAM|nr:hypothetical protein K488DRAFT_52741 [Vararia minispora EC-137]